MAQYNVTANGQTQTFDVRSGKLHVHISGTFGSGTAKLQMKSDSGTDWLDLQGASWSAAADDIVELGPQSVNTVRLDLSGATSPDLTVILRD